VPDLRLSLGVRIEELRNSLKLTRAQLAEILDVDVRQIAAYELEGVWPSPEMAFSLKKAFGVELHDLYDLTPTRTIPRVSIEQRLEIREQRRGARKRDKRDTG
jgi:transcriptional regulator with XRE-family HTH domain